APCRKPLEARDAGHVAMHDNRQFHASARRRTIDARTHAPGPMTATHPAPRISPAGLLLRVVAATLAGVAIWKIGLSLLPPAATSVQRLMAGTPISVLVCGLLAIAMRSDRRGVELLGLADTGAVLK